MQATQTTTIERINELTAERSKLYRLASNGGRTPGVMAQIHAISAELERLWELRRQERAGRVEGIDAFIDGQYASIYGRNYEEVMAPPTVGEPEDDKLPVAA